MKMLQGTLWGVTLLGALALGGCGAHTGILELHQGDRVALGLTVTAMAEAVHKAHSVDVGEVVGWDSTGATGLVQPIAEEDDPISGRRCRAYRQLINMKKIEGRTPVYFSDLEAVYCLENGYWIAARPWAAEE